MFIHLLKAENFPTLNHSPHDNCNQPHDGLIQTVKEIPQRLALLLHVPNDEAKAHGEDHESERIDSINRSQHWYQLFSFEFLRLVIQTEQRVVHQNFNCDHPLGILCFKLWKVERIELLDFVYHLMGNQIFSVFRALKTYLLRTSLH